MLILMNEAAWGAQDPPYIKWATHEQGEETSPASAFYIGHHFLGP